MSIGGFELSDAVDELDWIFDLLPALERFIYKHLGIIEHIRVMCDILIRDPM